MSISGQGVAWIAVDWGTSSLRIWVIGVDGSILQTISADQGMSKLAPNQYEGILLELCGAWLQTDSATTVIVCGMAGSREGWQQAPYMEAPLAVATNEQPIFVPTVDPRLSVYITPGLMQMDPAEVMRGEETQVKGLLSHYPNFDGIVLLPGTHSKWVVVAHKRIETFSTYMTGELFAILSEHSVLRQALDSNEWSQNDFDSGLMQAFERPVDLTTRLFHLRAESLLRKTRPERLKARLSGELIGMELASICAKRDIDQATKDIAIIGAPAIAELYQQGLGLIGLSSIVLSNETMTLAGLDSVRQTISEAAAVD